MDLIEEIKSRINIVDLAVQLGLEPTSNDFIYSVFKSEKNRSMKLYKKTNTFYDYSTGTPGDVINLFASIKKIENEDAIRILAEELGITSNYNLPTGQAGIERLQNYKIKEKQKPNKSMKNIEIYHSLEKFCNGVDEETHQYLKGTKRGLTEETIKRFRIFSISDLNKTIDHLFGNFNIDELTASGLFNEKGKFVFANNRLIIPYLDGDKIVYLRGRIITEVEGNDNSQRDGLPKYIGLAGQPAKRFFNMNAIKDLNEGYEILICEGEFDTIVAEQMGYKAVGVPGVNNYPDDIEEILKNYEPVICFDNDDAGEKGMKRAAECFKKEVKGIKLLKHKDITEVFCNGGKNNLLDEDTVKIMPLNDRLPKLIDANELSSIEIPDTNFIIENLLPEGANLFAGKPKEGKSIIGMNMALAVAQGGKLFSHFNANKNGVLYLSYEDSIARLKKRINIMKKIDHIDTLPKNLYFPLEPYDFPVLDENGLKILECYLERIKNIKLIIIDTLGRGIDPKVYAKGVSYAGEYSYNSLLHRFAHKNHISILLIHHTRKAPAENDFDEILGTTGIGGAMDNIFILKKVSGNYVFHIRGRDVEEKEFRIKRVEESYSWVIEGESKSIQLTEEKKEIIELLTDANSIMTTGQIAKSLGKKVSNMSRHLKPLEQEGLIFSHGFGKWAIFPKEVKQSKNGKSSKSELKLLNLEETEE